MFPDCFLIVSGDPCLRGEIVLKRIGEFLGVFVPEEGENRELNCFKFFLGEDLERQGVRHDYPY